MPPDLLPKATSVREDGTADGFEIGTGWWPETDGHGVTRLVASVPVDRLPAVHRATLAVLRPPLGFLYRQVVDRRAPAPEGSPPRDLVALALDEERLRHALIDASLLVYHDARAEYWVRGTDGDQVVLDGDGLIYCYPDDPAFRDALVAAGVPEGKVETLQQRDYVRHQFLAAADPLEDALLARLGLVAVPPQRRSG